MRTLNLDSLSANCFDKSDSSSSSSMTASSGAVSEDGEGPTVDGEGLAIGEFIEDLELDRDRTMRGVPWLFFSWLGTCEALTILHFFRRVALDQYMPRN